MRYREPAGPLIVMRVLIWREAIRVIQSTDMKLDEVTTDLPITT